MEQNIILLFGGESDERLVSVASAQALALALGSPKLWFWHRNGAIYDVVLSSLLEHKNPFTEEFIPQEPPLFTNISEAIKSPGADHHVFVLGTHGGTGENGFLQSILEKSARSFTGSNATSSELAFNKVATKEHLRLSNLKMSPHLVINREDKTHAKELFAFLSEHGEIVIKPICGGSSLGCHFVRSFEEMTDVLDALQKNPGAYMAEKLIKGRELTVGVIDTAQGPLALPVTEIVTVKDRDFDYDGKYLGVGSREVTPAQISDADAREVQRAAVTAHATLSLEGYSRSDMILSGDGLYFLETNSLPGLSKQSLVPQQLAAANITVREFLSYQIKLALERNMNALSSDLKQDSRHEMY